MIRVVLDTNGLLMPFQFSLNLDDEIQRLMGDAQVYVPSSVNKELKGIGKKAPIELAKKYDEVEVEKTGDEGVLEAARKLDAVIVTNDKRLKKRAIKHRIPVAYLRSKSHLEILGEDWMDSSRGKKEEKVKDEEEKKEKEEEKEEGCEDRRMRLKGKVVSGVNEGQYFLALEGYKKRFKKRFGFVPFAGTLNVKLDEKFLKRYESLKDEEGEIIEGFVEKGKHFGSVKCFSCELKSNGKRLRRNTFIIIPERTRYDEVVEIISEFELREELELEDYDEIKISVTSASAST